MVYLLFGYFLFTYNLIKKRVLKDLNVLKKVGIIPIYLTNNCQQHI